MNNNELQQAAERLKMSIHSADTTGYDYVIKDLAEQIDNILLLIADANWLSSQEEGKVHDWEQVKKDVENELESISSVVRNQDFDLGFKTGWAACSISPVPAVVKGAEEVLDEIAIKNGWGSWSRVLLDFNQNQIATILVEKMEIEAINKYASQFKSLSAPAEGGGIVEGIDKDWHLPVNGVIDVPDALDALVNKIGMQLRFFAYSGKGEVETVAAIAKIAQEYFLKSPLPQSVQDAGEEKKDSSKWISVEQQQILDAVDKIRHQSGAYIWAYPITYRDSNNKVEKITFGWELEWASGKTSNYSVECNDYFEALNEGIKSYQ